MLNISVTVCLASAAILFMATAFTIRLRLAHLATLTFVTIALYAVVLVARPANLLITNVLVLLVALLVGSFLGKLFVNSSALVSFCITAAIVDIISSQVGITAKLSHAFQTGSSPLLQYLSLSFSIHKSLHPIVGISDLVVITAIYFALRRAGQVGWLAFAAPAAGLLLALAVGLLVGGIAALPFIATTTVAFVMITRRQIHVSD